jgi:Tol biopolymer transport system component
MSGRLRNAVKRTLVWVDHEGNEETLNVMPDAYEDPSISPDGARIAYSITGNGNSDIWIYDLARGTKTRLTFDEAGDYVPIWTPDSKRIIFCSERAGRQSIFWKSADGTGKVEQIASVPNGWIWPASLSRDGNTLFFGQVITGTTSGGYNIGMLSMEGDRTPKLLLHENYGEFNPQISPDGRWLAYQSNESGPDQPEVYVRPFPDVESGGKWQVSTSGGRYPLWSPNGRTVFYVGPDGFMAVPVETDPTFTLGAPQILFSGPYLDSDISPDGKRFLMVKAEGDESSDSETATADPRKINIVLNWFEELKERVPKE